MQDFLETRCSPHLDAWLPDQLIGVRVLLMNILSECDCVWAEGERLSRELPHLPQRALFSLAPQEHTP